MGFQYKPLKPNEFRLLQPVSRPSNPLSFDLVHISLLSKPRYAALSYTWGPEPDAHTILPTIQLNEHHFDVRQNLHNALHQIKASKLIDHYLWVDAICINQAKDALDERSLQITHMKQIYEEAAKIIVWLGKPKNDESNRLAFSMMKGFKKRFLDVQKKGRPYRPWWWKREENIPRTVGQDMADFLLTLSPAADKEVFDVPGSLTDTAWLGIRPDCG
jgi:Heterokaryon incompatibility protein (HET)